MKKTIKILLVIIILLAAFLRFYKLDQVPSSLNWDEVAAGYNAYTIANWGRDEWNHFLPLVFTSFKDDKHPVHIYLTAPFVKIFGLSDFVVRFPSALIGVLSVLVIFYLAKILFKDNLTALLSALFLAISPYSIQFSRGLWEVNFALFFFILGLLLFYLALTKRNWLISISYLIFGIGLLADHTSKVMVPPMVLLLTLLYFKDLKKLSKHFYIGILIFLFFIGLLIINPRLTGLARIQQTQFEQSDIKKTLVYQKTQNLLLGFGGVIFNQYLSHFTPQYLFISGDQTPRNSVKTFGEFYKLEAAFILVGLLYLLKIHSKITIILLAWLILSPLPSSLVKGAPDAHRAIFMLGVLNLLSARGAGYLFNLFKGKFRFAIIVVILSLLSMQFFSYINYYFNVYPKKDVHEWQYGMKQIVEFVNEHQEYGQVFVTDERSQPYIFFLYYLKFSLSQYLNNVVYNTDKENKKTNTVSYFGGYFLGNKGELRRMNAYFGGWDEIESKPEKGILYILTPSQYDGLKHRGLFDVKKIIQNPDGGNTFYLVSGI